MPARTDPVVAFFYKLIADNTTIAFLDQATFTTIHTLEFKVPLVLDPGFLQSLRNKGYLPYRRWALISLDVALHEIACLVWDQARVARIRFPEMNATSSAPLNIAVQMAVVGVREGEPGNGGSAGISSTTGRRQDPLLSFAFEWKVDGFATSFAVTKIDSFDVGDGASSDLTLTIVHEANADPYRNWLATGNAPRDGSLVIMNTALQACYTVSFTGLRVRSVMPPISTQSSSPGTVSLTYSNVRFGDG